MECTALNVLTQAGKIIGRFHNYFDLAYQQNEQIPRTAHFFPYNY